MRPALCSILVVVLAAGTADAAPPPPSPSPSPSGPLTELPLAKHRVVYDNLTVLRYNPLGVEDQFNLAYRRRFYANPAPLYRDAYAGIAFTPTVNPAVARIGATAEIRPLTILSLSAGYYFVSYFGSFGHLQSSPFSNAPHSDSDIRARNDAGANYGAAGGELQLRAQLLAKVGPIVFRSDTNFFSSSLNLREGDRYFYNPQSDLLVRNKGWSMTSDFDVLALTHFGLILGARTTLAHSFVRDADRDPTGASLNTPTLRAGPLAGYVFFDEPGRSFNRPTLLLIANWWLKHEYRTGQDVSQAIPYLILAFRFEGELWKSN